MLIDDRWCFLINFNLQSKFNYKLVFKIKNKLTKNSNY